MANIPNDILKESISALVDGETDDFDLRRVLKEAETSPSVRETWRRYHLIGAAMRGELRGELGSSTRAGSQQSSPDLASLDLAARVRAALDNPQPRPEESLPAAMTLPAATSTHAGAVAVARWWEGAGKASIAATVAIGVLLGAQQFGGIEQVPLDPIAEVDLPSDQSATVFVPAGFQAPYHSAQHASVGSQSTRSTSYLNSATYRPITLKASRVVGDQELQEYLNHVLLKHAEQASAASGLGVVPIARVSKLDRQDVVAGDQPAEKSVQQQQ